MSWTASFANSPKGSNSLGNVDDEIRQLKNEIVTFMSRDHYFDVPTLGTDVDTLSLQGRLKAGSAKAQSGVGATMAFPTVRPDGTAFTEADDGRIIWANVADRGLSQYIGYWRPTGDGQPDLKWWPISAAPVGSIMAYRGASLWRQSGGSGGTGSDPASLAQNTMPGWVACTGETFGYTYNFGTPKNGVARLIPLSVTTPDLRDHHLKGMVSYATADYPSTDGGVVTPTLAAFSKTLIAANLPVHDHALDASGLPAITVDTHGESTVKQRLVDSGWFGGSGMLDGVGASWNTPGAVAKTLGFVSTDVAHPALSLYTDGQPHTVNNAWAANARTGDGGQATPTAIDFASTPVEQKQWAGVVWIMRVL